MLSGGKGHLQRAPAPGVCPATMKNSDDPSEADYEQSEREESSRGCSQSS